MKRSAVLAALVLFVGCARQMAPPGGPADTTPPYVAGTSPANDSVRVGGETPICILFSETMDHRSVEEAIFISPQSEQVPKFRWRGDALQIRLADGLRMDRTYVITIGQASADEWRNRMVASHSFRFATGDVVNQGELFGRVVRSNEHVGQAFAWLYDLGVVSEPDLSNDVAHYVTQPDDAGHFQFSGLGPGRYRVFVFVDANQNKAYTPGVDALAVPPQDISLTDDLGPFRLGDLKSVVRDTSAPVLSAIRTSDQHHVLMRFDEMVSIVTEPVISGLVIQAVYQDADSGRVGLFTQKQQSGQSYEVRISVVDRSGNRADIESAVRGDGTADRRLPEILNVHPKLLDARILPDARLEMIFSDAMAPDIVEPFWVASDTTLSPTGRFDWMAANHLIFTPAESWPLDQVRLQSVVGAVKDVVGHALKDRIVFDFTVIDADEAGTIAGSISPLDQFGMIEAVSMETAHISYRAQVAPGDSTFEMTGVIPGFYRVSGFVDVNGDGLWTRGTALPFVPAEALISLADTVEVPSRWTVDTRRLEALSGWFLPIVTKDMP
ncbi:MAG: Ig-like domain-containing protein [Candidatus Latescibacteria bacterium]|nr:Ig-like domain-containing protein [Candidatus Latescibacterota bacterium]